MLRPGQTMLPPEQTHEPSLYQQPEQEAHHEHLSQEEIDRAFAQIAIILALERTLNEEDEQLFTAEHPAPAPNTRPHGPGISTNEAAEIFGLLDHALTKPTSIGYGEPQADHSRLKRS